jgi:hypothetical protein
MSRLKLQRTAQAVLAQGNGNLAALLTEAEKLLEEQEILQEYWQTMYFGAVAQVYHLIGREDLVDSAKRLALAGSQRTIHHVKEVQDALQALRVSSVQGTPSEALLPEEPARQGL